MEGSKRVWFPAVRYGWGWGPPVTWQGWLVLAGFLVLLVAGAYLFPPKEKVFQFLVYTAGIVGALLAVCYAKGERPAWRWGRK